MLYDGSYKYADHYPIALSGSYDPTKLHEVCIKLDINARRFSFYVDDELVGSNSFRSEFTNVHMVRFSLPIRFGGVVGPEAVFDISEIRVMQ